MSHPQTRSHLSHRVHDVSSVRRNGGIPNVSAVRQFGDGHILHVRPCRATPQPEFVDADECSCQAEEHDNEAQPETGLVLLDFAQQNGSAGSIFGGVTRYRRMCVAGRELPGIRFPFQTLKINADIRGGVIARITVFLERLED
ncbi:MAG: hypothetical protein ACJ746_25985 [Bryobacteraceae bacterium]